MLFSDVPKFPLALKRPVLWALAFLIFGVVFEGAYFVPAFVLAGVVCAFLYAIYRYWPVIFFMGFFLLGAWRVEHSLFNHTVEPTRVVFSGVVLDVGYTAGGNQRAAIRGIHPETGGQVRVMAYIRPHQPHLLLGQEVTVTGELLPLNRALNPGGYDQFQHLRSQKIDATIWPDTIETGEVQRTLMVVLRQFRERLSAVYDEILPPREAGVIKSMVLGDRHDMDRDLADAYRVMGIFHILSISGLHVGILMMATNKALSLVLEERRAGFVVLVLMVLYCLLTGASVATVRAVTMGGVLVSGKIIYREYDLLASVSWACIALLLFEPLYLFNVGFQLSFSAVYGIGLLTSPIERCLTRLRFPKRSAFWLNLRKSLSVGIAAVVSTYIVFAFHFYEIPLYSVLGNLVIAPTTTIILVLGLLVGLVGLVSIQVAQVLSGAVYFILRFYEISAVFFADLPFAMIRTGGGSLIVSALGVLVLGTFVYTCHSFGDDFKMRRRIFVASVSLLIAAVFIHQNPRNLQITEIKSFPRIQAPAPNEYVTVIIEPTPYVNYTILRRRTDTLIIGAPHGNEDALLHYLDKRNVNQAALLLTHPPHPSNSARLAQLLPRIHTLYLPAHAEGVTASLMHYALQDLTLPENIVFLQDGDSRIANGVSVRVYAAEMGMFNFSINVD